MKMIFRTAKWELLLFFLMNSAVTLGIFYTAFRTGHEGVMKPQTWVYYLSMIVASTLIIGYVAGLRIQRKIDVLNLNMLQVTKGNLSTRISAGEDSSFSGIYPQFNAMMNAIEERMKWVQRLGEQEVVEKEKAAEVAVLEERRRMARDLHDTVSQQLFAMHMSASALPSLLKHNQDQGYVVLEQLITMSQTAQKQMRALIAQLRPVELEDRSLEEALDVWFPDYCRQNGLKGVKEQEFLGELSDAIEHQMFLIIQEAMANIVKHAGASLVSLSLREEDRQIVFSVSDNGKGFRPQEAGRHGSYGLMTMKERAEKLGGHIDIITHPGAGTTIRVHIPKFKADS
ncbi:sensor histidine kinase [Paenibacillus sp. Marseille-Q4541]|uniref:sensor histidine kinase n=1 Tax=Paenibacillus sp. Marseille-Q4541 TaxID=2831522 RepID=UPI001BACB1C8|nr:sensor histidine kinase [Paenibacillus sp. Marseille-Q4541]